MDNCKFIPAAFRGNYHSASWEEVDMIKNLLGLAGFMKWQYELGKKKKTGEDLDNRTVRLLLNNHFLTERGLDQLWHVI
jgi:hypothetical protein